MKRVPPRRSGSIQRTNTKSSMGQVRPAVMPNRNPITRPVRPKNPTTSTYK